MIFDQILLAMAILGHGVILILILNVSHGYGINLKWIDAVVLGLLILAGVGSLGAAFFLWNRPLAFWPVTLQLYTAICLGTLLVGLPLTTMRRGLRRPPAEAKKLSEEVVDLLETAPMGEFLGIGRVSRILRMPGNESFRLHRVEYEAHLASAPPAIDGLEILHLTDLHFSHAFSRKYFEAVMDLAADGPAPDLVLITGDFVDHDDVVGWIGPVLERLTARVGKFAILGNHDYRHPVRPIRRALRDAGFRVLEGRWAGVDFQGARIAIGGTTEPWGRSLDYLAAPEADFRLLLSHSPDEIYAASRHDVDLMLAGHVHGGQVRLPLLGPVLMPSRYSRRFDRGFFREGPTLLHVGQGIAGKHPFRRGCPPEIARLRLKTPADASGLAQGVRMAAEIPAGVPSGGW